MMSYKELAGTRTQQKRELGRDSAKHLLACKPMNNPIALNGTKGLQEDKSCTGWEWSSQQDTGLGLSRPGVIPG